jgi:hypothetical protein
LNLGERGYWWVRSPGGPRPVSDAISVGFLPLSCSFPRHRLLYRDGQNVSGTMAKAKRRKRYYIPWRSKRQKNIVIVVAIVAAAAVLIIVGLALYNANRPSETGYNVPPGAGYTTPTNASVNQSSVQVDSYTYSTDFRSGITTFNVTVTNNNDTEQTRNLTVTVYQTAGVPSPNQPYPSRQTPGNAPTPMGSTNVTLAPKETRSFDVAVAAPPGQAIDPGTIVITLT